MSDWMSVNDMACWYLCAKRTGSSWWRYWALLWQKKNLILGQSTQAHQPNQPNDQLAQRTTNPTQPTANPTNSSQQYFFVYQSSLSAVHLHAAVHYCRRGEPDWRLCCCLKYSFCIFLLKYLVCLNYFSCIFLFTIFFYSYIYLVNCCLVVEGSDCCIPLPEN